jgi:hypothetical protein
MDLLDAAIQSIRSYDVYVKVETNIYFRSWQVGEIKVDKTGRPVYPETRCRKLKPGEQPGVLREHFRQVFQGGLFRIEELDPQTGQLDRINVFDGQVERRWIPRNNAAMITSLHPSLLGYGHDYYETFRGISGRADHLRVLRQREHVELRNDKNGSRVVPILEAEPLDLDKAPSVADLPQFGFRLYLEPKWNLLPSRVERFMMIDGKQVPVCDLQIHEVKELTKGVLVPTKAITKTFITDKNDKDLFGTLGNEIILTVDSQRSRWNERLPADLFQLPLPGGTNVVDFTRKVEYVTGKPDAGENLEALAAHALQERQLITAPPLVATHQWSNWLIYGVPSLIVLVILYAWSLRRQKHQSAT